MQARAYAADLKLAQLIVTVTMPQLNQIGICTTNFKHGDFPQQNRLLLILIARTEIDQLTKLQYLIL